MTDFIPDPSVGRCLHCIDRQIISTLRTYLVATHVAPSERDPLWHTVTRLLAHRDQIAEYPDPARCPARPDPSGGASSSGSEGDRRFAAPENRFAGP